MKRIIICTIVVFLFSMCSDDWWWIYWRKPHHGFDVENKTNKKIYTGGCIVGTPKKEYSCFSDSFASDILLSSSDFLDRTIYINKKNNVRVINILHEMTTESVCGFDIRFEDIIPHEDGIIAYLLVCYIDDLYMVYYGKTDVVTCWRYGYTLEDLQRYNWNVPFPDNSGTIKTVKFEYRIKEREILTYDDIIGNK